MSKALEVALKSAEQQQEKEMTSSFSARMQESVNDVGTPDTLRHTILSYVTTENYERAVVELKKYIDSKGEYPQFKERAERYSAYAIDLVNAVKAKRSFPGVQQLPVSKQQDLFDRAMDHFEDLKATLRKIEQIDRDVKMEDVRSTAIVVKAVMYSMFAITILGFVLEISRGVVTASWYVIDSTFGSITNWIFDKIGF